MEAYLHEAIPLSAAMGTKVRTATPEGVILEAPLRPNRNHRSMAFGGSVAAQGILAGWTLVHVRLEEEGVVARTVIQRSEVAYLEPVEGDFEAHTVTVDAHAWARFRAAVDRFGRGRIRVTVEIRCAGLLVARVKGDYVALAGVDEES